jgi:hypothetical protein
MNRQARQEREEKIRILAIFAPFALGKMTKHRFTMDFEKAIVIASLREAIPV